MGAGCRAGHLTHTTTTSLSWLPSFKSCSRLRCASGGITWVLSATPVLSAPCVPATPVCCMPGERCTRCRGPGARGTQRNGRWWWRANPASPYARPCVCTYALRTQGMGKVQSRQGPVCDQCGTLRILDLRRAADGWPLYPGRPCFESSSVCDSLTCDDWLLWSTCV